MSTGNGNDVDVKAMQAELRELRARVRTLEAEKRRPTLEGHGVVRSQLPAAGQPIPRGERVRVILQPAYAAVGREPEDALALAATESTAEGATP